MWQCLYLQCECYCYYRLDTSRNGYVSVFTRTSALAYTLTGGDFGSPDSDNGQDTHAVPIWSGWFGKLPV